MLLLDLMWDLWGTLEVNSLTKLKHMDMMHSGVTGESNLEMWSGTIESFAERNFSLETLSCDMFINDADAEFDSGGNMAEFLGSLPHADTLKVLKLYRPPFGSPYDFYLLDRHRPTVLTEIYFWGTIVPNFDFLQLTPKLQKLFISLGCYEKRTQVINELQNQGRTYQKYETDMVSACQAPPSDLILPDLEYFHVDYAFNAQSLGGIALCMPNLKVLETILKSATIPVVYGHWKKLKELVCLPQSCLDDCSIVGNNQEPGLVSLQGMILLHLFERMLRK